MDRAVNREHSRKNLHIVPFENSGTLCFSAWLVAQRRSLTYLVDMIDRSHPPQHTRERHVPDAVQEDQDDLHSANTDSFF